ncbi:MAG: uroporphyrinogen-III C-methyltransferase [Planctomycetes bacterium]|nr:uroporphyrinogen-III C-methyltransferase [Planctomycetota bacterium]
MQDEGVVYLVGAGPGDPGLMTLRGLRLLRRADVVVHDRLIARELLRHVPRHAEIIDAGKAAGDHRLKQGQINTVLIDRARRGMVVVRLKGGDPYVFGRGFEELTACRQAEVPCFVVPGVSSALAGPAAAGIPLTERQSVRSLAVVTGRLAEHRPSPPLDYQALAGIDTVVVLMVRERLPQVAQAMVDAGRAPGTPAAAIHAATTPQQRVAVGTVATIAEAVAHDRLDSPVLLVVGAVAAYAAEPAHHSTPLAGRRVVVTRPTSSGGEMCRLLADAGAAPIPCPLTRIDYDADCAELDASIRRLSEYQWVAFTSMHGVRGFFRRVASAGADARAMGGCRVAAIGPATARRLQRVGIRPDVIPAAATAESLAEAMVAAGGGGGAPGKVLHPRADIARPTLAERLRQAGATVDGCIAYRTIEAEPPKEAVLALGEGVDAVVLCSPSAVRRFVGLRLPRAGAIIACIGPVTAGAALDAGLTVDVVSSRHSSAGMVAALAGHFSGAPANT